ncbi:MAG: twin-arginine translocase subunit TatC, partial [Muribaculaceae bacterium]|nr:twin-arginine translocase subunit TatC [Muribaculaceae bacterium]
MSSESKVTSMTFWDHLDELRGVIVKIIGVTLFFGIIAFIFKEKLFEIVLAPKEPGFITYRLLEQIEAYFSDSGIDTFSVALINTGLAEQFIIHMKTALCAGVLCSSPYILYQLFRFVSPALYTKEKRYAKRVVGSGYLMFICGVLLSYFLIFPLTFRFLGTYQVADDVTNLISLESYMSTLIVMSLSMGIVFEMPVIVWLFGKMGLISPAFMRKYRRHAIVIILIVAAIITPTSDIFTLLIVSLPMWMLYEASILLIRHP